MFNRNLETLWDDFEIDFIYSKNRDGKTYFLKIDHFLAFGGMETIYACVIHDIDNLSDHEPVCCWIPLSNSKVNCSGSTNLTCIIFNTSPLTDAAIFTTPHIKPQL